MMGGFQLEENEGDVGKSDELVAPFPPMQAQLANNVILRPPEELQETVDSSSSEDEQITEASRGNDDDDWLVNERPDDGVNYEDDDVEETAKITFHPPAYIQRYCKVRDVLQTLFESEKYKGVNASTGKTIMEVGCAEFGMMKYFKNMMDVGKLIFLDLDKELMEENAHLLRPLPAEYIQKPNRPQPLMVEAYAGCVTKVDAKLIQDNPNIFAIVGIEIVEHLHPGILRGFEETVFGVYSPQIVIVTTPNSEFNEVFNLPYGKFRHWDHKFEWNRAEFKAWCEKIIGEFKEYSYSIEGICEGPVEVRHLGCVSQMAVFEKKMIDNESSEPTSQTSTKTVPLEYTFRIENSAYSLIQSVEFPNYIETRSMEEIALSEFRYYVDNYLMTPSSVEEYLYEKDMKTLKLPLEYFQKVHRMPKAIKEDVSILRNVLKDTEYKIIDEDGEPNVVFDLVAIAASMEQYNIHDDDSNSDLDENEMSEGLTLNDNDENENQDTNTTASNLEVEESWE